MTAAPIPARHWRTVAALLAVALAGVVIRDGADRRPADPSRPLVRRTIPAATCQRESLRLVGFNIHSGKGDGNITDLGRTADTLGEFDFAGLYEVRSPRFGEHPDQAADLAQQLQCGSLFAPTETHWWREHFGNALLSRWALGPVQRIPLPGTRGKAYRNLVLTDFPWRDRTVRILSAHIDREDDRVVQLELAIHLFLSLEPPVVLMGDLNTTIGDPQLAALFKTEGVASPLHDALGDAVPADTIDWMFTRGLRTVSAELVENSASDHPVLRAELALPEP
jgi:endonuclease/exonuclease/phosphatase family metal-dependent hydrolase